MSELNDKINATLLNLAKLDAVLGEVAVNYFGIGENQPNRNCLILNGFPTASAFMWIALDYVEKVTEAIKELEKIQKKEPSSDGSN